MNLTNAKPLDNLLKTTSKKGKYEIPFTKNVILDNENIYPVSEFCGINASHTNPADEKISFISVTLACIDISSLEELKIYSYRKIRWIGDNVGIVNLERKISNYEFPFLSLGALVHQKIKKEKGCYVFIKYKTVNQKKTKKKKPFVLTKKKRWTKPQISYLMEP